MNNYIVYIILNLTGIYLIIKWLSYQIKDYRSLQNKIDFFRFKRFRFLIIVLAILLVPLSIVNLTP